MTIANHPSPLSRALQALLSAYPGAKSALGQTRGSGARNLTALCLAVLGLASCGGGNPLNNPPEVSNPVETGGQKLSFTYYQKCINPIFLAQLPIPGTASTNTCSAGGCHDNVTGIGGALRLRPGAADVVVGAPPDVAALQASDMYKNFLSAKGQVNFNDPAESRLVAKPLVQGVLHGGGRVFLDDQDANVKLIEYWMTHPATQGQDEFSTPAPTTC
ncbi:MAG: hypothetical protein ABI605_17440 [Rhizobacter sp.]